MAVEPSQRKEVNL